jgi:hypothetical protein
MLAAAISVGLRGDMKRILEEILCEVPGATEKEATLLTLMATRARLAALEIVLAQTGVATLGVSHKNLSELVFEVRRGTMISHIVSKSISRYECDELFPELKIGEVLSNDWEKEVPEGKLVNALKLLVKIAGAENRGIPQ